MTATLLSVRVWPCEATCDAPACRDRVDFVLRFENAPTPGLNTLYLCAAHKTQTEKAYAA